MSHCNRAKTKTRITVIGNVIKLIIVHKGDIIKLFSEVKINVISVDKGEFSRSLSEVEKHRFRIRGWHLLYIHRKSQCYFKVRIVPINCRVEKRLQNKPETKRYRHITKQVLHSVVTAWKQCHIIILAF